MQRDKFKKRLYRKVNTKTWNVHHLSGLDYKYTRNTKRETREQVLGSMRQNKRRGLDYTPLFKFLLSKVGSDWDAVFSEAKSRIDKTEPIFWMVAIHAHEKEDMVRMGESSYYSGLFVDDEGILQLSNPKLCPDDLKVYCTCCTHTFNGIPYGQQK